MGDTAIAQDLIDGVADALSDLGATRTVRVFTVGTLDPNNPGAGGARTSEDHIVEVLLYDYADEYVDGSNVLAGDKKAFISIEPLSESEIASIDAGANLVDGSDVYSVVSVERIEAAGTVVTLILQLRGH